MGLCASSEGAMKAAASPDEQNADKAIQRELEKDSNQDKQVKKLLLLGAGASGKSTLFKQMNSIYGTPLSENQRKSYIPIIHQNVISSIRALIANVPKFSQAPINPQITATEIHQMLQGDSKEEQILTVDLGHHISLLWADPAIRAAYAHQDEFQLTDSAKYFFDEIARVSAAAYVPTEQDVLRSRAPTTGIVENHFTIEQNRFAMFDVGGQRNERKKWIHCFENVTAVLFVAALSEYNQVLFEDHTQNRLTESLTLFEEICNTKYLMQVSMMLFLNKRDIFAEKIPIHPLHDYFPEYEGNNSYEDAARWIRKQFEGRNPTKERQIYCHITCATDKNNVRAVFEAVKDIVLRKNLQAAFGIS